MRTLWRYVVVHDGGTAPHFGPPLTTLAICKPKIRKGAAFGDLAMAFAGRPISIDPHQVVWAGIVSEKLTFEEYWADERFQDKKPDATALPDNIYRPGPSGLVQVPNPIHGERHVVKDCGGEFVLVLDPAWHLDPGAGTLPEPFAHLRLSPDDRRGHRRSELRLEDEADLTAWLASRARPASDVPGAAALGWTTTSRYR
jgi:hypothetical protein